MGFAQRLYQHDLSLTDPTHSKAGMFREMGSVASNFGIYGTQLGGASHRTTIFANRAFEGGRMKGWVGFDANSGRGEIFKTAKGAMEFQGYKTGGIRETAFKLGAYGRSAGATLNLGLTALTAFGDFRNARREGAGMGEALGEAAWGAGKVMLAQKAISLAVTNPYVAVGAAVVGGGLILAKSAVNSVQMGNRYRQQAHLSEMTGNRSATMHTRAAATMRQRALMSINNSQFNAMRSLGNEASFTHMPKSRYGNSTHSAGPRPILGY